MTDDPDDDDFRAAGQIESIDDAFPPDTEFYARGRESLGEVVRLAMQRALTPPKRMTLSEWAAEHGRLSAETSSTTGRFRPYPYQPGIMDAITDPAISDISVMKSARVGFTRILDLAIGYYVHQDPSPILVVQPRVEDAEDYSKTEIVPMIRDTPALNEIAPEAKSRSSGDTILKKVFRNGASITFVGANSPGGFRRITVRVVIFDEVDGYPISGAGTEGDQIRLGKKRSDTFWNRKVIKGSTPTIDQFSRIQTEWELGDCRFFEVPCPHCGLFQRLEWGGPELPYGMKWLKDDKGQSLPETVYYLCKAGCVIHEISKPKMVAAGKWVATKEPKTRGRTSFHIWTGYSLFPNAAWAMLVDEWLTAKNDPLARQTFYNTVLGLPYEDFGEGALRKEDLRDREKGWDGDVPNEAVVLTAGVDVQDHRAEVEVVAWDQGEQSWSIDYSVIEGDPETKEFWSVVEAHLQKQWIKPNGTKMVVTSACVDSGGHHTQAVYNFCKARLARKWFAIKGNAEPGGKRTPVWPAVRPTVRKKKAFRPVLLGVNSAKDVIRSRLHIGAPGPGYMHFPPNRGENYYAQLTSEKLVPKVVNGFRFRVWELLPGRANEALDVRVYAYAALCALAHFGVFKVGRTDAPSERTAKPPEAGPGVKPTPVVPTPVVAPMPAKPPPAGPAAVAQAPTSGKVGVVPASGTESRAAKLVRKLA